MMLINYYLLQGWGLKVLIVFIMKILDKCILVLF